MQGALHRAYHKHRGRKVKVLVWAVQVSSSRGVATAPAHLRAGLPLSSGVRQNCPADARVRAAGSQKVGAGNEQTDARECAEEARFEAIDWRIGQEI